MYNVLLINASGYIVDRNHFETVTEALALADEWSTDYPGHAIDIKFVLPARAPTWTELTLA